MRRVRVLVQCGCECRVLSAACECCARRRPAGGQRLVTLCNAHCTRIASLCTRIRRTPRGLSTPPNHVDLRPWLDLQIVTRSRPRRRGAACCLVPAEDGRALHLPRPDGAGDAAGRAGARRRAAPAHRAGHGDVLSEGALLHRDSVGSVHAIRPGDVNWMTAGRALPPERTPGDQRSTGGAISGLQLWVALPRTPGGGARLQPPRPRRPAHRRRRRRHVRVVAGSFLGARSPVPLLWETCWPT